MSSRRGDLDPDLESAIDTLKIGEVSAPVRTRLGYHLIEVLSREGDRSKVRHILARIESVRPTWRWRAARRKSALARIQGGEYFADVAKAVSDDELTRDNGGDLGWTPVQALVPAIAAMIDSVGMSGVSPVVESDRGYHVFKVLNRRSGGTYDFEDVQDRLRQYVEQQELEKAYDTVDDRGAGFRLRGGQELGAVTGERDAGRGEGGAVDLRLDVFLNKVRLLKSRTLAKEACDRGKITVNGEPAKGSRSVHPGDRMRIDLAVRRDRGGGGGGAGRSGLPQGCPRSLSRDRGPTGGSLTMTMLRYPKDAATGFKAGDLRGAISVRVRVPDSR